MSTWSLLGRVWSNHESLASVLFHPRTLEHELKEIREQEDEMLAGQRGSRLAKWIATSDDVRQQAGLTAPEAMKCLGFGSSML